MIKDFVRGGMETEVRFSLCFFFEKNCGFAFPCDKDGNLFWDQMQEPAKKNYADCMAHPEDYPCAFNEVMRESWSYRVPNSGTCHCGEKVNLTDDYMGACQCPNCGQWYNLFGDELLPPDAWEEDW